MNLETTIERLARQIADEIVPYECNRNADLRALLLEFAREIKRAATEEPHSEDGEDLP